MIYNMGRDEIKNIGIAQNLILKIGYSDSGVFCLEYLLLFRFFPVLGEVCAIR